MRKEAPILVRQVAKLILERNAIDDRIAHIIKRPALAGHLGEWLASQVFDVDLEASASEEAIDCRFAAGALAGKTVNVKWYAKREGPLDLTSSELLDYYLIFTGPKGTAMRSAGGTRPLFIDACYLFDARALLRHQIERGAKVGIASSVPAAEWDAAEIYPQPTNRVLPVGPEQIELLKLLGSQGILS